jgi:ribosome biogenesis GTPase
MTDAGKIVRGRVLRTVGGIYHVEVRDATIECTVRGRLKRERGLGRVAVGDSVEVERLADGTSVIVGVLPRESRLSRRVSGGRREQIIAANVDQLVAVFSEANEISAFVVLNKMDLAELEEARGVISDYERAGYPVLYISARRRTGLTELRARLVNHITLFVGPSGVGKSSLLNELEPGLGLRVGEISRTLERGTHTTVAASLHPLERGGYVVDTPGLGKLEFLQMGARELAWCFLEFRPYVERCRFPDCTHSHEPDCAVRAATESSALPERRYQSYLRMLEEGSR